MLPEELPDDGGVELVPPLELGEDELELGDEELGLFFSVSDEDDGGVLMPELEDEDPGEDGGVLEVPPVDEPLDVAPLVPLSPDGWSQP